jgi:hypothetical protein
MEQQHRFRPVLGIVAALVAVGLAACGSNSGGRDVASLDGSKAKAKSSESAKQATPAEVAAAWRKFAQCMRDHGVDMPDPKVSSGDGKGSFVQIGGPGQKEPQVSRTKMDAAQKACQPLVDRVVGGGPGRNDPEQEARAKRQALAFAKCMRDHGVDMPDPQFESGGRVTQRLGGSPNDPKFRAAQKACAKSGPGGFMLGGGGPAGGST